MEVAAQHQKEINQAKKRAKCPGVRVIGGRVYDSEHGVCCHQCRQKTREFAASCKNMMGHKPCTFKFCHKCLMNRYGEKAREVDVLSDWKCPRCRGICNCSFCMKRRGQRPTGPLVHTAKASGFSSVSEMLEVRVPNPTGSDAIQNVTVSPMKAATLEKDQIVVLDNPAGIDKELIVTLSGKHEKENSLDGNDRLIFDCQYTLPKSERKPILKEIFNDIRVDDACQNRSLKTFKIGHEVQIGETEQNANDDNENCNEVSETQINGDDYIIQVDEEEEMSEQDCNDTLNHVNKEIISSIPLPPGSILTDIEGIEFPPEHVGHALQFLEFCSAFEKILDLKDGEAKDILQVLISEQNSSRAQRNSVAQFHTRLLTLILSYSGNEFPSFKSTSRKKPWLKAMRDLFSGSNYVPKELQLDLDSLEDDIDKYYNLDLSKKLRLLNFLCDEALGTEDFRDYIDDENSLFAQNNKDAKVKLAAAIEKERILKQKMKDDLAKAIISKNGGPLSITEHASIVTTIKSEIDRAHAEMLEAKGMVPKRKQGSDAMRTEPVFLDNSGKAFWKPKCYPGEYAVLMQDLTIEDADAAGERWFVYGTEQEREIEMYMFSRRTKRRRTRKVSRTLPNESALPNESTLPTESTLPNENALPNESALPNENALPNESALPNENALPNESVEAKI